MLTKPLSQITIYTMGRENLEKRISKFYADSSDSDTVIQYLVAVLIRHSLCISDFSDFCSDLVRELLLFAEPTDVLRKCGPLFKNYFKEEKEWTQVKNRLYKNKNEYHRFNNRLSDCKKYLFTPTTPMEETDGQQYKILSTFEDAVGKLHTWSLRDADSNSSGMKIDAVLELMSSLTIFEKEGIRRFVKLENSDIQNCTRHPKIRKGKVVEESVKVETARSKEEALTEFDFSHMTEDEKLNLVKALLPEGIVLTDTRMEELKKDEAKEAPTEIPAETTQKAESISDLATATVKEPPKTKSQKSSTPRPMALSAAKKLPYESYKKPKSEKQKELEYKDGLIRKAKKGTKKAKEDKKKSRKRKRK